MGITRQVRALTCAASVALAGAVIASAPSDAAPQPGQGSWAALAPLDLDSNGNGRLESSELSTFGGHLDSLRPIGVEAISVDVWWGKTEPSDQNFQWGYYDDIFSFIKDKGFKIVPIFSFHQCGGNVGDDCDIPVPSWVFGLGDDDTMKYRSESGNVSNEYVAHWAYETVPEVKEQYTQWISAFVGQFGTTYRDDFSEINVSLGPSGELRYPAYNQHDAGVPAQAYPNRGTLQAYSGAAKADFRSYLLDRYTDLAGINAAWGLTGSAALTDISQINPPADATGFFDRQDYIGTNYGRDFVDWYVQSLADYGRSMLADSMCTIGSANFPGTPIGYKIPGIHWRVATDGNPHPRSAEVTAGLVKTSELDQDNGYGSVVSVGGPYTGCGARPVVLHFTALELANGRDGASAFSRAEDLVGWVANAAGAQDVTIKGENALAPEVANDGGWDRIDRAFRDFSYTGLTVLRAGDVAGGTARARFEQLIRRYEAETSAFPSLHVPGSHNGWSSAGTPLTRGTDGVWRGTFVSSTAPSEVKFNVNPSDWNRNFGGAGVSGTAVDGGSNISLDPSSSYSVTFDDTTLAYTFTKTTSPSTEVGLPGTYNGFSDTANTMTGDTTLTGYVAASTAADQGFKFFVDGQRLGGTSSTSGTASASAGDIELQPGRFYRVTFVPATKEYTVTDLGYSTVTVEYAEPEAFGQNALHVFGPDFSTASTSNMTYVGLLNGRHWWRGTVTAPAGATAPVTDFSFCFRVQPQGGGESWDCGGSLDRSWTSTQPGVVYIKPGDATVYTTRPS